jgi:Flp pilus assembly protein TadB
MNWAMNSFTLALVLSLLAVIGAALAFGWWDVVRPRKQARAKREQRRNERRQSKLRSVLFEDLWKMRRTRRLTDQRPRDDDQPE